MEWLVEHDHCMHIADRFGNVERCEGGYIHGGANYQRRCGRRVGRGVVGGWGVCGRLFVSFMMV